MKYLKIFIPLVLIAVAGVWGYGKLSENKKVLDEIANQTEPVVSRIPVKTAAVESSPIGDKLVIIGNFQARKELTIIAETQGRITGLFINEGQEIARGQQVATLDDTSIKAQLQAAQAAFDKAQKDVERYKNLLYAGAISQTQYEEIHLGMQNQETNLTTLQQQLTYSSVHSPMRGTVKEVMLEEGSFARPGEEIASIVDISRLDMVVKVDEIDIVKVKQGQQVEIQTEVYPDYLFKGRVSRISVQADLSRKYEIVIELDNSSSHPLKAGMYGSVTIPLQGQVKTEALLIPRKSVVGSLKNPSVYLVEDGKATLRSIDLGDNVGDQMIVKEGLEKGDRVIITGQINLEDGRAIRVVEDSLSISENTQSK